MSKKTKSENREQTAADYAALAAYALARDLSRQEFARALTLGWAALLLKSETEEVWSKSAPKLTSAPLVKKLSFPNNLPKAEWERELTELPTSVQAAPKEALGRHLLFLQSAVKEHEPALGETWQSFVRQPQAIALGVVFFFLLIGFVRARNSDRIEQHVSDAAPRPTEQNNSGTSTRPVVFIDELSSTTEDGTYWAAPENRSFETEGLELRFRSSVQTSKLSLSLDGNDTYAIRFFNGSQLIAGVVVGAGAGPGMRARILKVPFRDAFDHLEIIPLTGDNRYSIGHVEVFPLITDIVSPG